MKTPKLLQRGLILWRARPGVESGQTDTELPDLCPVARCERCGYEFEAYTISAVCPRCLEAFSREPCYGGCFSCPLLASGEKKEGRANTTG